MDSVAHVIKHNEHFALIFAHMISKAKWKQKGVYSKGQTCTIVNQLKWSSIFLFIYLFIKIKTSRMITNVHAF